MTPTKPCVLLLAFSLVTACSGPEFTKPPEDLLVIGKSTKAEAAALLTLPPAKGKMISNGEEIELVNYTFSKSDSAAVFERVTPSRSLGLYFHEGVLVGREFTSSFLSDHTYFDPEAVELVVRGMTEAEVVSRLGKPAGTRHYPLVKDAEKLCLVYLYVQAVGFKTEVSRLHILLDGEGIVEGVTFEQTAGP